jgi:hypothetical protein
VSLTSWYRWPAQRSVAPTVLQHLMSLAALLFVEQAQLAKASIRPWPRPAGFSESTDRFLQPIHPTASSASFLRTQITADCPISH